MLLVVILGRYWLLATAVVVTGHWPRPFSEPLCRMGIASNCRQPLDRVQANVFGHQVEIRIIVYYLKIMFATECAYQDIDSLANRNAF